ncbi:RraA family protein [Bosea rubneri]|uniref:Putative 4-hydroxy-4-methyl-2-oxoglutarate aldolase n=1 Tax=Bosea rubneri TaxID=3075434 RepID=A0ABU3SDK2_9HYPH|nr:RraA family protein [Bosea sp. ZW T0_25]MDU0342868.1 RraA family protein [Bosea sp. ZW T0_25]
MSSEKNAAAAASAEIGTAVFWDAAEKIHGPWTLAHRTVESVRALRPDDHAIGPAYTIRLRRASDSWTSNREDFLRAYDEAPEGAVVVVEVQTDIGGCAMGDLVAHRLSQCKVAGVIINGAIRDLVGLKQIAPPTWYREITMAGPISREITVEVGVDVTVGGAVIRSGDLVCADVDGVFVTPKNEAAKIQEKAREIVAKEAVINARLAAGEDLRTILLGQAEPAH